MIKSQPSNSWYLGIFIVGAAVLCMAGCQSVRAPQSCSDMWDPGAAPKPANDFAERREAGRRQLPDALEQLRLPQLLEIALAQNPTLRRAWQESRAAEAGMLQKESGYYPQVTVSGVGSWQRSDANTTFTEMDTTSYGPSAKLNWLLLDYGGRRAGYEAALQALRASNFSFNKAFQDLALNVQQSYFNLLAAQAAVEAAQSDVTASGKTLESAQKKRDAGLGVELDVLQALADRDKALYNQENANGTLRVAAGNLAVAVGLPPDMEIKIAPPEQAAPTETMDDDLQTMLDGALARRPDIAALRATFDARVADVRAARSDRWPTLNFNASANKYWNRYSDDAMSDNDTHEYAGLLSLDWNIFDGMLRLQKQRAAEANLETARYKLQEAELSAGADVWSKYHSYQTAQRKLVFSRSYLKNAQGAYDLAAQAYAAGLKTIVDLLNAQSTLAAARDELVQTEKDVWMALAQLANALGDLRY